MLRNGTMGEKHVNESGDSSGYESSVQSKTALWIKQHAEEEQ